MFEDKRFKSNNDDNEQNRFFNFGSSNDNLNFNEESARKKTVKVKKEKKKTNKGFLIIILIVVLVLGLAVGGILYYIKVINSPYNVYKNVITYGCQYLDNKIKDIESKSLDYDKNKDILTSTGTLTIKTSLLDELKNYEFKYKLGLDVNKEMVDASLLINQNKKNVLDFEAYLRNNKVLLNLKDVYGKYLQVAEITSLDNLSKYDFDYSVLFDITRIVKDTLIKNLDKNKISTEKTKLKVQNSMLDVKSHNYILKASIYEDIIDNMLNDSSFIDKVADMLEIRKAEIKDALKSLKENDDILENLEDIEFRIYTTGITNKIVGVKVFILNEDIITFTKYNDIINVIVGNDGNTLDITKTNKDTTIVLNADNEEIASVIITASGDKTNYEFNMERDKKEIKGNLEVETQRVANKKLSTNIGFVLKGIIDKDSFDLEINLDNETQVGGTIQNIPSNNIVGYDSLSANEKNDIQNKFNEIINKLPFGDIFEKGNGSNENNENIDYCEIATDCECSGVICDCSYIDSEGKEQTISCLNKDMAMN